MLCGLVKFIKKIREEILGESQYGMHQLMGLPDTRAYIAFEEGTRSLNAEKLVKLWKVSKLSGDQFMKLIEQEVTRATK